MSPSAASAMIRSSSKVVEQFALSLVALSKALRHRREVKNLAEFDDRMLSDIGLSRGDVSSALAEPLYLNPSWVLVRCVDQRVPTERMADPARKMRPVVRLVKSAA